MDTVAVIGNGESRSCINFNDYKGRITLIGCNAIHRELVVDHLVCCDQRMVRESVSRKKSRKIPFIYTRERYFRDFNKLEKNKRVQLLPVLPYSGQLKQDQPEHWGSGPYAVLLAATMGFKNVCIFGFDLYGRDNLINNIYKGTQNYLGANASPVDPSYWIYQLKKVFQLFPHISFKLYNSEDWQCPVEWTLPNVEVFNTKTFTLD